MIKLLKRLLFGKPVKKVSRVEQQRRHEAKLYNEDRPRRATAPAESPRVEPSRFASRVDDGLDYTPYVAPVQHSSSHSSHSHSSYGGGDSSYGGSCSSSSSSSSDSSSSSSCSSSSD